MKPSRTDHLGPTEDPEEAPGRSAKAPFSAEFDRLDDLAAAHGDPPRRGAERDLLGEGSSAGGADKIPEQQLVDSPRPAPRAVRSGSRRMVFGKLPAAQQPGAERAAPAGDAVGVGGGVADQAPAGPLVELGLVGASSASRGTRGGAGRSRSSRAGGARTAGRR